MEHGTRTRNGKGRRGNIINEAGTGRSIAAPGSHEIPYGRGIACVAALPIWRWLANARDRDSILVFTFQEFSSAARLGVLPQGPVDLIFFFFLGYLQSEVFCGTGNKGGLNSGMTAGCLPSIWPHLGLKLAVYPAQTVNTRFPHLLVAAGAWNVSQVVPV